MVRNRSPRCGVYGAMRRSHRASAALAIAATTTILLAACTGSGLGGSPGTSTPPPDNSGIAHPAGSELVFKMEYTGGFVPVESLFTSTPAATITGDGTVITQGAMMEIFPGPALAPMQSRRLTEAGLQLVLERLAETGFFGESAAFSEDAGAADAQTTVFTLHADDREVTVSVGGLGMASPNAGERERQAHAMLASLSEDLSALDQLVPESAWDETAWHPYEPAALRLLVRNADNDPANPDGIPGTEAAWPTDADPAAFGEPFAPLEGSSCGGVTGEEAQAWLAALAEANQLTRFTAGDHLYAVLARPVLPGEEPACPQAALPA